MKSDRSKFIDDARHRAQMGDITVFEECFTPDFKFTLPETKSFPDGSLHGLDAIKAMGAFEKGDLGSWESITRENIVEIETEAQTFRIMKWTAKKPYNDYFCFKNLNPNLEVVLHVFQLYMFRDGKICEDFETYDTFGYFMDIVQHDEEKLLKALPALLNMPAPEF